MHEAQLYQKLENKQVKCELCHNYCMIKNGSAGRCCVRSNHDGVLYSLIYGKVVAQNIDPMEKKPLFHFMPGQKIYSIGTMGCNFHCLHCQNSDISQAQEINLECNYEIVGIDMKAEQVVEEAIKNKCPGVAYTYNEPTVFFEFAFDCMKIAKSKGLKNVWVSNGYMSEKCLEQIIPYLDAINVDLKFFTQCNYDNICGANMRPVIENIKILKKAGVWIELATVIIPGYNDSEEELKNMSNFIASELSADTPWHILRFFPNYKMAHVLPTEKDILIKAYEIGKKAGLKYVYLGNFYSSQYESTYCGQGHLVIERKGYEVRRFDKDCKCIECGEKIVIVE